MKKLYFPLLILFSCFSFAQEATHLNFDGVNDYVLVSSTTSPITTSYTKEAMIMSTSTQPIGDFFSGSTYSQNALWIIGGKLVAGHNGSAGGSWTHVTDPEFFTANVWHHVALTYDALTTTMKLYKDGLLVATNTAVPVASNDPVLGRLYIGSYNSNNSLFKGNVDEVRLWNRVLSVEELQNNINCELNLTSAQVGLVLYYKFNQGVAGANNTTVTSAIDSSGNNYNGTLTNFTLTGSTSNWLDGSPITTGTNCALGINSFTEDKTFKIYPNPVNRELTIESSSVFEKAILEISDINGRLLQKRTLQNSVTKILVADLANGIYFFKIGTSVTKIIKK